MSATEDVKKKSEKKDYFLLEGIQPVGVVVAPFEESVAYVVGEQIRVPE
jgi:hypothetical protein